MVGNTDVDINDEGAFRVKNFVHRILETKERECDEEGRMRSFAHFEDESAEGVELEGVVCE